METFIQESVPSKDKSTCGVGDWPNQKGKIPLPEINTHPIEEALKVNHRLFGGKPLKEGTIKRAIEKYKEFWRAHKMVGAPDLFEFPGRLVDRVWHTHMCETKQYAKETQAYFGQMFHHSAATCDMSVTEKAA